MFSHMMGETTEGLRADEKHADMSKSKAKLEAMLPKAEFTLMVRVHDHP